MQYSKVGKYFLMILILDFRIDGNHWSVNLILAKQFTGLLSILGQIQMTNKAVYYAYFSANSTISRSTVSGASPCLEVAPELKLKEPSECTKASLPLPSSLFLSLSPFPSLSPSSLSSLSFTDYICSMHSSFYLWLLWLPIGWSVPLNCEPKQATIWSSCFEQGIYLSNGEEVVDTKVGIGK